jgi:quercetin dioxygenase-like cupin family protein
MATHTTTGVTHYHAQKKRRAQFIEDWRRNHRTVVALEDVTPQATARGVRTGVYVGADGDRLTRTMDAHVHEIDPGSASVRHRHSGDAMVFVVAGRETLRYLTFSSEPMLDTMGMSILEDDTDTDIAELPPRPPYTGHLDGDDPCARRVRRLSRGQDARRSGRLHTSWDDLELLNTPRGTRTTFLLDRAVGYQASGITMAMFEIGRGRGQSMHRRPDEVWLYVVEGSGHSYLGAEPEGGQVHPWKKGDIIVVDHFLWHQHINDDPDRTAKVVRIHMFDSLLETMRPLCDPLVLFEEPPAHIRDAQAGDASTIEWPALERPTWP